MNWFECIYCIYLLTCTQQQCLLPLQEQSFPSLGANTTLLENTGIAGPEVGKGGTGEPEPGPRGADCLTLLQ